MPRAGKNITIEFDFYGTTSENIPKNYEITMDVNLIENGFPKKEKNTAICYSMKDIKVVKDSEIVAFNCIIYNIPSNITSFQYNSSKVISGVPTDKSALLNPKIVDQNIAKGNIEEITNNTEYKIIPIFKPTKIDFNKCKEKGEFTLVGDLSSDLNDILQFKLQILSPKMTVDCNIKPTDKESEAEINCQTNKKIDRNEFLISQNSIFDEKNNEKLIIEKYELTNGNIECDDGQLVTVNNKLESNPPLSFRQVSNFNKNRVSFFFAGLTTRNLKKGDIIILKVALYKKGNKKPQEVDIRCDLNSDVNPQNGGYSQADFNCLNNSISGEFEDIIILSSDNVTGIDSLQEYQKSPKSTDDKIEETKRDNGIGKVIDYSSPVNKLNTLPILEISKIDSKNCQNKGKIRLTAKFNEDFNQKIDFDIPLSYPILSIKCSNTKAKANIEVIIDCKVQKEFSDVDRFIIEPTIIKKKNKEFFIVSKTNLTLEDKNCADYNQKQIENSQQKYNADYTFLQANSFTLNQGKILFNLIIYSLISYYEKKFLYLIH